MSKTKPTAILQQAIELQALKGADYNSGIELSDYFPYGHLSYLHMLNTKILRLRSVGERAYAEGPDSPTKPNFESLQDSVLDLINYASFYGAYLADQEKDQRKATQNDG